MSWMFSDVIGRSNTLTQFSDLLSKVETLSD